ncbi:SIS domain-containing protein [Candidatus Poriferisodalis sp.]|uniref:SIS domain-containing protein n=1 Tax=Candidatus Poriferisodalis sp. TaxID=3101277 RepID=UPI003B516AB0
MEPLKPEVMFGQVAGLAGDLRQLTRPFEQQVRAVLTPSEWKAVKKVYLTGDGDSYHASCAAEMAFQVIADVACEPLSAQRFLDYRAAWMRPATPPHTLVIATSASGGTERVVQAIERAKEYGALTVALTGTPNSAVTQVADRSVVVELPHKERSPGIRTYQASLVGMLLVAMQLAERQGRYAQEETDRLRQELIALADVVDATTNAIQAGCREVADMIAASPIVVMLGSGPSYGTALYSAAKLVEAAGVFVLGQDLEEWWHVERFAYPLDMPVFVIAPPGRSHWRAQSVAATARGLGRRVIAVTHTDDTEVTRHAHMVLPVQGEVREEFSPLLYPLFTSYVAAHVAERLGRCPFQSDRPELLRSVNAYFASQRQDAGRD